MSIDQIKIADFMTAFSGANKNYGQHIYGEIKEGEKEKGGKNQTITNKLLTIEQYKDHLNGKKGLGVIPINEDNECKFAVIDIDIYNVNLLMYISAIDRNNFPIVPFKSKSGGYHLYVFFKQFISAKTGIEITRKYANALSIDTLVKKHKNELLEIFPKQYSLKQGSVGNWINLPYYNHESTRAYAIKDDKALNLEQALLLIREKTRTVKDHEAFLNDLPYSDAPPCLQTIYILNPLGENDGRNEYLFSFGAYLKKKNEDFFEQGLFQINEALNNPIDRDELEKTILQSLRKKDYSYKCRQAPCLHYCNKNLCKKREFGVGKQDGYFSALEYGKMYQYKTLQPYYEWEVRLQGQDNFVKLRFKNEDEIIKQDAFLKLCFRELRNLPYKLKQGEWFKLVNQHLMEIEVVTIDDAYDTSPISMLKALFFDFLLNRAMAATREQILNKRVYFEIGKMLYYFRSKDFNEFLYMQRNFHYFGPGEIHAFLKDFGAKPDRLRLDNGKQIRVYAIHHACIPDVTMTDEIENPDFSRYEEDPFK
jgi:hypothetical protein